MVINNEITLDISKQTQFVKISLPQGDNVDRVFKINLVNGVDTYIIPTTATVRFEMARPDGSIIYNNCPVENNQAVLEITPLISAIDGRFPAQFRITDSSTGGLIKSFRFHILIHESVDIENAVVNTSEFTALQDMELRVGDITPAIQAAETATDNANNAADSANDIADQLEVETLIIWKPYVSTYVNIATTYPTPELGWTTQAQDTGIRWRYNGVAWINIGTSTDDKVGDLSTVTTTNKTNVVSAINELDSQLAEKAKKIDFFVNVKSFGAKPDWDGTTGTDNIDAFINAITAAIDLGAALYIPEGTYYIGNWVQYIVNSPLKICGSGKLVGTSTSFLSVNHDFEMSGIEFENWHDIILCTGETELHDVLRVTNCKAKNINRFVATSFKTEYPTSGYRLIYINRNKIVNSNQKASIIINSPKFESLYIIKNFIDGATEQAIRVGNNTDVYFKTRKCVFIKDNIINNLKGVDGAETKQILVYADQVEIIGNQLENVIGGTTGQNEGIYTKARYCKIERNVLKNVGHTNGEGAIVTKGAMYDDYIADPSVDNIFGYNTIIRDNIIINTRSGVNIRAIDTMTSNLLISGNLTEGNMYEDVRITGVSKHISIIENQFMSVSTHGIRCTSSIERIIISNNMINSNSFACISLSGSSAKWVTISSNQLIGLAKITRTLDLTALALENVIVNGNLMNNSTRGIVFATEAINKNILYTNNMILGIGLERVPTVDETNNILEFNNIGTN